MGFNRTTPAFVNYPKVRLLSWISRLFGRNGGKATIKFDKVRNVLPNSGAIPVKEKYSSAREIVLAHRDPNKRRLNIKGYEGFALDDAVFDAEAERAEMESFARLSEFLAAFAHANYKRPSILELGCGPAHLFFFLRRYGIWNYMGIDGNPYFVRFNSLLGGFEEHFLIFDLQEEIKLREGERPLKFDLVCSFEVLEHIREDKVDNFIQTIQNHMHSRSVAFCTASLQSQMDVHVLVRERKWWLERFARFGLFPVSNEGELIAKLGQNHPFNWNPSNSSIFALELGDRRSGVG